MEQRTINFDGKIISADTGEEVESGFKLRDYQIDTVNRVRESMIAGNKRVILQAACGAGKTCMFSDIAKKAHTKGKKILFLANRRELIYQAKKTLESCGLTCGVIMAGEESQLDAQIQIASQQTYVRRMDLEELRFNQWWHNADLICCDECHSSISPTFQKILKNYEGKHIIGLTATPCRGDGRGLGEFYDDIVPAISISDLIEKQYLVPVKYYAPSTPDLSGIKTVAGDYDKKELGERVNTKKLVGDIYENWSTICPDRPTIIFATNVAHSIAIKEQFERNGVSIAHVDAKTPKEERDEALDGLKRGSIQVITNVGILCEGFDFPEASCIVLARPTKSLGLYIQMGGRGLRIAKGKDHVKILDHAGCLENLGRIEWDREWSLDGKNKAWKEKKPKEKKETKQLLKCPSCHAVFEGEKNCPDCGSELKTFGKKIETEEGELKEVGKGKATVAEKRMYLGMLKAWVPRQKNNNPKRIIGAFRGRYGIWPHHSYADVAPIEPDEAFINRMRHEAIKFAKRNNREGVNP